MSAPPHPAPKSRPYHLTFYRDDRREHRWRVTHANGRIIADCGEGYKNEADCRGAVQHFLADLATHGQLDCGSRQSA